MKKHPKVIQAGRKLDLSDVLSDPVVGFQKSVDPFFSLFMCFGFPSLVSSCLWGEGLLCSFFVGGCLRYSIVLHSSWLVNSAAHIYGSRPYDKTINPADNLYVSALSGGEGWHNWHHKFPYDYAGSEFGAHQKYNPTKVFIDVCAWLGLVSDRKRALGAWKLVKLKKIQSCQQTNYANCCLLRKSFEYFDTV